MDPLSQTIDDVPLAFLDVETTGLAPYQGDRVCEIAILRCRYGEPEDALQQLIDPQRPIGAGAFAVNGITEDMLRGAPTFAQIADQVMSILEGAVAVCHNARFDLGFVSNEFALLGGQLPAVPALDTLRLAKSMLLLRSYSLGRLAEALEVFVDGRAHRAMVDVLLTRGVFERLTDALWSRGIRTLGDILALQGGSAEVEPRLTVDVPPVILEALRGEWLMRLRYQAPGAPETERLVRPLAVLDRGGFPSLVAHCYLRDARRHFRLDRILAMELVRDSGEAPNSDSASATPDR